MLIDWGKLVAQGRAKAHGVSWSEEEVKAVSSISRASGKPMAEVANYVRKGILTMDAFKEAQGKPDIVNPYLELPKEDLIKKAQALGVSVSPDATKEVVAQIILDGKKEQAMKAKAEVKKEEPKEPAKAPVKKLAPKPKAKPTKKK